MNWRIFTDSTRAGIASELHLGWLDFHHCCPPKREVRRSIPAYSFAKVSSVDDPHVRGPPRKEIPGTGQMRRRRNGAHMKWIKNIAAIVGVLAALQTGLTALLLGGPGLLDALQSFYYRLYASEWTYMTLKMSDKQRIGEIEEWVNTECQPRDGSGIRGFVSQSAPGNAYDLHVWCRKDHSNIKWKGYPREWKPETMQKLIDGFKTGNRALVGLYNGLGGATLYTMEMQD